MSGAGRPRTPTKVKELRGTKRKDRTNENEPKPGTGQMSPTLKLSDDERAIWNELVPQLVKVGIAKDTDCQALTILVQHEHIRRQANEMLTETGLLTKGSTGQIRINPLFKAHHDASAAVSRMLVEFGMTPSARTRVETDPPPNDTGFGID